MRRRDILIAIMAAGLLQVPQTFAQHGHGGGMGAGMGNSMGRDSMNQSSKDSHGNPSAGNSSMGGQKSPSELLTQNSKLSSKLESLLPRGTTAQQACSGFKNLGQCVAAVHVSHNLGISFDCLKADMTGQAPPSGSACPNGTGSKSMSLGKSIQVLDPHADAKAEAKKGNQQANQDLKPAGS